MTNPFDWKKTDDIYEIPYLQKRKKEKKTRGERKTKQVRKKKSNFEVFSIRIMNMREKR